MPGNTLDQRIRALMEQVTDSIILPRYRNLSKREIVEKATDDLVTIADREAEDALYEGLARLEPGLTIVGEEAAFADPGVLEDLSGDCWIIDPIDGTHNFASGKAPFGILLAQASGGVCRSGWIYDCLSRRFCSAHRGKGAKIDEDRVTARSTGAKKPIAAISTLYLNAKQKAVVERVIEPAFDLVDIPRCAAEQYPRLALGQNDISTFQRTLAWDHAAGVLWLNEAGGMAARFDGSAYRVDDGGTPGLVGASSPAIWIDFVERLTARL
ncbi:inositol monophosphatase family protein [Qipengyuania sp. CAU 1752]